MPILIHLTQESKSHYRAIHNLTLPPRYNLPLTHAGVLSFFDTCLSNSDLKLFIKKNSFLGYHASGTCAMGHKGVLSSNLKVKNIDNLRVIDASVMPKIIRGNTNASVIMIAEKGADYILSKK